MPVKYLIYEPCYTPERFWTIRVLFKAIVAGAVWMISLAKNPLNSLQYKLFRYRAALIQYLAILSKTPVRQRVIADLGLDGKQQDLE